MGLVVCEQRNHLREEASLGLNQIPGPTLVSQRGDRAWQCSALTGTGRGRSQSPQRAMAAPTTGLTGGEAGHTLSFFSKVTIIQ